MRRHAAPAWLLVPLLLAPMVAGCSSPDAPAGGLGTAAGSAAFAGCVERLGVSLEGAAGWSADRQRDVVSRPEVLECAVGELDDDRLRAVVRGAYDEASSDVLVGDVRSWIRSTDIGAEPLAEDSGRIVGALDQESDDWLPSAHDVTLAWAIYTRTEGEPAGFEDWAATRDDLSPEDAVTRYVQELRSAEDGSADYAAWEAVNDIELELRRAREAMS